MSNNTLVLIGVCCLWTSFCSSLDSISNYTTTHPLNERNGLLYFPLLTKNHYQQQLDGNQKKAGYSSSLTSDNKNLVTHFPVLRRIRHESNESHHRTSLESIISSSSYSQFPHYSDYKLRYENIYRLSNDEFYSNLSNTKMSNEEFFPQSKLNATSLFIQKKRYKKRENTPVSFKSSGVKSKSQKLHEIQSILKQSKVDEVSVKDEMDGSEDMKNETIMSTQSKINFYYIGLNKPHKTVNFTRTPIKVSGTGNKSHEEGTMPKNKPNQIFAKCTNSNPISTTVSTIPVSKNCQNNIFGTRKINPTAFQVKIKSSIKSSTSSSTSVTKTLQLFPSIKTNVNKIVMDRASLVLPQINIPFVKAVNLYKRLNKRAKALSSSDVPISTTNTVQVHSRELVHSKSGKRGANSTFSVRGIGVSWKPKLTKPQLEKVYQDPSWKNIDNKKETIRFKGSRIIPHEFTSTPTNHFSSSTSLTFLKLAADMKERTREEVIEKYVHPATEMQQSEHESKIVSDSSQPSHVKGERNVLDSHEVGSNSSSSIHNSLFPESQIYNYLKQSSLSANVGQFASSHLPNKNPQHLGHESVYSFSNNSNNSYPLVTNNYDNCTLLNPCLLDGESNETEFLDERLQLILKFKQKHPVSLWESIGFYDDNFLSLVNNHWLQFDPAYPIAHKVLAVLYAVIMIIGCGGNLLVIFMFVRCRSLRTPANYLVINLAISDFFMLAKMPIFIYNSFYEGPALGAFGCKIYGFLGGLTGTCSIMTLAVISLDRYFVIVFPMNPLKRTTSSRALLMLAGVWIYAATFSTIPLLGVVNGYVSEGYLTSCSFDYLSEKISDRIFVLIFFVAAWVFPLIIIVFSYFKIFKIVREAERLQFGDANSSGQRESFKSKQDKSKQKAEVKIALLSSFIILIWTLAWTPYACVALLGVFGFHDVITPLVSSIPALFCKTASCIDPFVYAINHPKFQRELRNKCSLCPGSSSQRPKIKKRDQQSFSSQGNSQELCTMTAALGKKSSIIRKSTTSPPTRHGSFRYQKGKCSNMRDSSFFSTPNYNQKSFTDHLKTKTDRPFSDSNPSSSGQKFPNPQPNFENIEINKQGKVSSFTLEIFSSTDDNQKTISLNLPDNIGYYNEESNENNKDTEIGDQDKRKPKGNEKTNFLSPETESENICEDVPISAENQSYATSSKCEPASTRLNPRDNSYSKTLDKQPEMNEDSIQGTTELEEKVVPKKVKLETLIL